ncbi:MAG: FKBP-type peptidyl-prolyl cis-trans isomerase [Flavobacteriales bacterium]|nr:FKBP-type peptidyl-prolyl cis-trans isomerase [Flavobacteriales bacterium]
MKIKFVTFILLIVSIGMSSCKKSGKGSSPENPKMSNQTDSLSYALGVLVGTDLKNGGFSELNYEVLKASMQRAINGDSMVMDKMQATMLLQAYAMAEMKKKSSENEKGSNEFLEKNKKAEGVVTTKSGLQYKIVSEGKGPKPVDGQTVKVHYTGKLVDGKVFDSSVQRGEPAEFNINQVIPGWTEALKLMPVGSKYKLFIPPSLGYGDQSSETIPGGSVLIFDVELLEIVAASGDQK